MYFRYWQFVLAIFSGCLCSFVFIFPKFFLLSWIAWIPLLFAIQNESYKKSYFLSLLCGTSAYAIAMYWMANLSYFYFGFSKPFHYLFLLLFAIVAAHSFCLVFLSFQFLKKNTSFSDIFLFPVCLVFFSFYNPLTFHTAFGSTQAFFLSAIQAIEFTGIEGLSFLLAFFNVFCYKVLVRRKKIKKVSYFFFVTFLILWFSYGLYSSKKWNFFFNNWEKKKIAIVQPNHTASLSSSKDSKFFDIFPVEFSLMRAIKKEKPLVTIWPEGYNYQYQSLVKVREIFQEQLQLFQTNLLFVDNHYLPEGVYNSMFWLDNQGFLQDIYHKRTLVPFGEYFPLQDYYAPFLKWLGFPFGSFQKGKEAKIFSIAGMKIAPLICYESIVAHTATQSIGKNGKGKVFVVSTYDGWYHSKHQVLNHSMVSNLRAVENRVPLIHNINNGYSSVVMPNGEVVFQTPYLEQGVWTFDLPYSAEHGGSFYSQNPLLLKTIITTIFFLMFLIAIFKKFRDPK